MKGGEAGATASTREVSSLHFLRAIFAFLVLVGHARQQFLLPFGEIFGSDVGLFVRGIYFVTGFGSASVVGFFVLSGYLITHHHFGPLFEGSVSRGAFLLNRAIRIHTVLIPALLGSWLLVALSPLEQVCSWRSFLAALFLLQPLNPPAFAGNAPLWSLGYEAWCYVAFCGLVGGVGLLRGAERGKGLLWVLVGVAPLALFSLWMAHYLMLWTLGAMAALLQPRLFDSANGRGPLRVYRYLAIAGAIAGFVSARMGLPVVARDYVVAVPFAASLVFLSNSSGDGVSKSSRLGERLAQFSYSLYLTHYPLVLLAGTFWGAAVRPSPGALSWSGAVVLFCVGVAYLFSLQTERKTKFVRAWIAGKLGLELSSAGALARAHAGKG